MRSPTDSRQPRRQRLADRLLMLAEHLGNRWLRPLGTALFRLRGGRIGPRERVIVLLTTRGRRSGRAHSVLLQAFPNGDDPTADLVLVAANAGRPTDPDWYRNLMAAGTAVVERTGHAFPVRPEPLTAGEAEHWWPRIIAKAPTYQRYRRTAGREIPLVRLVRTSPAEPG